MYPPMMMPPPDTGTPPPETAPEPVPAPGIPMPPAPTPPTPVPTYGGPGFTLMAAHVDPNGSPEAQAVVQRGLEIGCAVLSVYPY